MPSSKETNTPINAPDPSESGKNTGQKDLGQPAWARDLALFSIILGDLIGFTGGGIAIGYWAWKNWAFPWWFLVVMALLGLVTAMFRLNQRGRKGR